MAKKPKKTNIKNKSFRSSYVDVFRDRLYNSLHPRFFVTPAELTNKFARVRKLEKPFFLHSPNSPHSPVYRHKQFKPKTLKFQDSKFKNVCYNRKVRKEVLFALRKIGFGIPTLKPRFTLESKIRCK